MSVTTVVRCDVCEGVIDSVTKDNKCVEMQVIFTTEQTEGKSCANYFSFLQLDLCDDCKERALSGHYIFAAGAQGCSNRYYFAKEPL